MTDKRNDSQIPLFELPEATKPEPPETGRKTLPRLKKKEPVKDGNPVPVSAQKSTTPKEQNRRKVSKNSIKNGKTKEPVSGLVPEGDVRLTANIRDDLHLKLKISAARRRTTIGELIEELVEKYL